MINTHFARCDNASITSRFNSQNYGAFTAMQWSVNEVMLLPASEHPVLNCFCVYNLPRFRNLFGRSTCLERKNSATFLPKMSYELEQLTPRSR